MAAIPRRVWRSARLASRPHRTGRPTAARPSYKVRPLAVATFLTLPQENRIHQAVATQTEVVKAHSWRELKAIVRSKPIAVVVLNPAASGMENIASVADMLLKFPLLPMIAYIEVDPASIRLLVQLSRRGLENVILQDFDDSPQQVRSTIEKVATNPFAERVLRTLRPRLGTLPDSITTVVEDLFKAPHRYANVGDLARNSGTSVVSLYREFDRANLGSPKKLIMAAKLLRAARYLRNPGHSVAEVAEKLGHTQTRIFVRHAQAVLGINPSRMRRGITFDALASHVLEWLTAKDSSQLNASKNIRQLGK